MTGEQKADAQVNRLALALGRKRPWMRRLAERYLREFAEGTRPRQRDVVEFVRRDTGVSRARRHEPNLSIHQWLTGPQAMQPVAAAESWPIPAIGTTQALADWLLVDPREMEWFADLKSLTQGRSASPQLGHYHYRVLRKRTGSVRMIEAPKPRLKWMQRQILARILGRIPAHPAAHGFVTGRSIQSFAKPHTGQRVVLRMDLRDFFPSICRARVQALFRTMGYPESVADLLGGICTNAVPRAAWTGVKGEQLREAWKLYDRPHVPQGAPTSPALANLCAYRVDCRLAGLAGSVGARYTRYADDLAFSGDDNFERRVRCFPDHIGAILLEEGFAANHRKTRILRQGVRQKLAGLVVNEQVNVPRAEFDRLKATLANCVRYGMESQNREAHSDFRAHLAGRVGFVESINPARGRRLRALFEQIR